MAELKTKKTEASVDDFLNTIADETKRKDCKEIVKMMQKASGSKGKMWGAAIIGFGDYRYKYESGRENDWFITGFSPRKQNITLYASCGFGYDAALLKKLGKHKVSGSCLHISKLEDVDKKVLQEIISSNVVKLKQSIKK